MDWEWPIIIYLWLAGMAGGAYFVTFLANLFSNQRYHHSKRVAAGLGLPFVILGVLMLVIDLGHPFRAWHLFTRFRIGSPMSVGSWLLLLWAILASVLFLKWWLDININRIKVRRLSKVIGVLARLDKWVSILDWVTFILSILLIAYTGVLLSAGSSPLWSSTVLLPVLFVASAISTGIAVINIAGSLGIREISHELISKLCKASMIVCTVEILALGALFLLMSDAGLGITTVYAKEISSVSLPVYEGSQLYSIQTLNSILWGPLSFAFWGGVMLVGLVLPLGIESSMMLRSVEKPTREVVIILGLMVLIGGLILRAVIVFGGQIQLIY